MLLPPTAMKLLTVSEEQQDALESMQNHRKLTGHRRLLLLRHLRRRQLHLRLVGKTLDNNQTQCKSTCATASC